MIKIISIEWVIKGDLILITETRRNKKGVLKYTATVKMEMANCIGCPFNFGRCNEFKRIKGWSYCTLLWQSPKVNDLLTGQGYIISPKEIKRGN